MKKFVSAIALVIVVTGCATIMRGTSQRFSVNAMPDGVRVYADGVDAGLTPTTIHLNRSRAHQIVFKKDGFDDIVINLDREFRYGWPVLGNLISWNVLGLVVDVANGSAYQLKPEELNISLAGESSAMGATVHKNEIDVFITTPAELKADK